MSAERRRRENTIVLFIAGLLVLNYPLLSIFDWPVLVWGIPMPYLYLFLVWIVIIALMAGIVERYGPESRAGDQPDSSDD